MTSVAGNLAPRPDAADGADLALGMPHLTAQGLSEAWLLRRAAHLHWGAVARHAGCLPGALRDETGAPLVVMPVLAEADLNGVGLLYFASFLRFFAAAEGAALAGPWRVPPPCLREVHWYGNADAGDEIELTCEQHVARGAEPCTHAFVSARRASDGALVACCETTREG